MPRSHDIEKALPKKRQKLLTVGKYDEASTIDSNSEHIDLSTVNSQFNVFETEENEQIPFDSTAKTHYILQNPKLGSESNHELPKANQRT
eukprot:3484655-Ditylum_brightwellii.AAC.1